MSDPDTPPRRPEDLVRLLFFAPATFILWLHYYFPKDGQVWVSARRRGNPTMELLYSLAFLAVVVTVAVMFVFGGDARSQPMRTLWLF